MIYYIIVGLFILFDVTTGLVKSFYRHKVDSSILRKGLYRKIGEIGCLTLSYMLELSGGLLNFGVVIPTTKYVTTYIVVMEIVSIIENLCVINPKFKNFFKKYLAKFSDEEEKK